MICDNIWDVLCRDNPSSLLQFVTLSLITHQAGRVCYLTQLNASKFVSHQNKLECIQQNVLYAFPLSQPASGHYPVCSTLSFYQFLVKHSVHSFSNSTIIRVFSDFILFLKLKREGSNNCKYYSVCRDHGQIHKKSICTYTK